MLPPIPEFPPQRDSDSHYHRLVFWDFEFTEETHNLCIRLCLAYFTHYIIF